MPNWPQRAPTRRDWSLIYLKNSSIGLPQIAKTSLAKLAKTANPGHETPEELMERFLASRAKDAYQLYMELDDSEQEELLSSFKQTRKPGRARTAATLNSALFRNEFSRWYAQQQWNEPNPNEVLIFAIAHPKSSHAS